MKFLLLFIVRISILISNKGSEKGSDSVDLYCDVVKFRKSRIALNQGFYRLVTCSESLFHLNKLCIAWYSKYHVLLYFNKNLITKNRCILYQLFPNCCRN